MQADRVGRKALVRRPRANLLMSAMSDVDERR
jgi:hypothetical protein